MTFSVPKDSEISEFIPLPNKLLSLSIKLMTAPAVPTPAPALISPVGFSSTEILTLIFFVFSSSLVSIFTFLKMFKLFNESKDLDILKELKTSPSEKKMAFLITVSSVISLPLTLILLISLFSLTSEILKVREILAGDNLFRL